MVAWLSATDQHRKACIKALHSVREPLVTVWPAVTEAMYLLAPRPLGQDSLLSQLGNGGLRLLALGEEDIPRMRELMTQYRDLPMDFADAALVRVAERERISTVFTVDRRDFTLYRPEGFARFRIIP